MTGSVATSAWSLPVVAPAWSLSWGTAAASARRTWACWRKLNERRALSVHIDIAHWRSDDRFVSELCQIPHETPVKYCHLRGRSDTYRCCGKSLMEPALMPVGVRQHAPPESISQHAPSTTRPSLHFRINSLRTRNDQNFADCDGRDHLRPFQYSRRGRPWDGTAARRRRSWPFCALRTLLATRATALDRRRPFPLASVRHMPRKLEV